MQHRSGAGKEVMEVLDGCSDGDIKFDIYIYVFQVSAGGPCVGRSSVYMYLLGGELAASLYVSNE